MKQGLLYNQVLPLSLTIVVLAVLSCILYVVITLLNALPVSEKILTQIHLTDVLVGATIYLKTAVDFAIFMGRVMNSNPGWKNRIAIEIGTGLGNALGTIAILVIWTFFKEIQILLALMVFIASLVLFELAHGGLEHFATWKQEKGIKSTLYLGMEGFLEPVLRLISPILSKVMPDLGAKLRGTKTLTWGSLFVFSFSVPFILGLDDFAGYVPLFNVVNVFGFSLGVFGAHALLNIALFISPGRTVAWVKNEWVSFFGSLAFILLAFWGLYEVAKILLNYR